MMLPSVRLISIALGRPAGRQTCRTKRLLLDLSTVATFICETVVYNIDFESYYSAPSPRVRERSIVMSAFVCLFVCLCVCPPVYLRNYMSNLHEFCACYRDLVLLRLALRCVMYSRFVDDVMFASLLLMARNIGDEKKTYAQSDSQGCSTYRAVYSN